MFETLINNYTLENFLFSFFFPLTFWDREKFLSFCCVFILLLLSQYKNKTSQNDNTKNGGNTTQSQIGLQAAASKQA